MTNVDWLIYLISGGSKGGPKDILLVITSPVLQQ